MNDTIKRHAMPPRTPTRTEVETLMKRCQVGVGGRNALDNAHSIMSDCYGTLGLLIQCLEQVTAERELWASVVARAKAEALRKKASNGYK